MEYLDDSRSDLMKSLTVDDDDETFNLRNNTIFLWSHTRLYSTRIDRE